MGPPLKGASPLSISAQSYDRPHNGHMLLLLLASAICHGGKAQFEDLGIDVGNDAACWVDVDNDGWTDLCTGGFVWRNDQGKQFVKSEAVGSVVAADYNNDGYVDLFSYSLKKLFLNHRGAAFEAVPLPPMPDSVSRGACWGDFNRDGFDDLYVGGFEDWDKNITYPSFILLNHGGHGMSLAWTSSNVRTRGVTACDFDRDGDLDVYVSNYRLQPNQLWVNDGFGQFADMAEKFGALATSTGFEGGHSIGASWGDFDNDGQFDLFAGNFAHQDDRGDQPKSRFLRNLGPSKNFVFDDKGPCGIFYQESYASPSVGDFDNDGSLDLYFTTVYMPASFNRANHPALFANKGNFDFQDVTDGSGLGSLAPTYQSAWADFDHDGRLDLVTAGKVFRNISAVGHWLEVVVRGDGRKIDRSAIGTQVRVTVGRQTMTRQVEAGTGEGNQNDLRLHFGIGAYSGKVSVEVTWLDKRRTSLRHVQTDRVVTVTR